MLRKVMLSLLILTSIGFVFLQLSDYRQRSAIGLALADSDFFALLKCLVMVVAGTVAAYAMVREARTTRRAIHGEKRTEQPEPSARRAIPLLNRAALSRAVALRPLAAGVFVVFALAVPLSLWSLAIGRSVGDFTLRDWLLVCLAEAPIVIVVLVIVYDNVKFRRN